MHSAKYFLLPLLLVGAAAHWLVWQHYTRKSIPAEVAQNAEAIRLNGSQDNLRRGFHQRETWSRVWPWLGHVAVGTVPFVAVAWVAGGRAWVPALAFLALGVLLAAAFAARFTPLLNLARGLPEFQPSHDSASWPDASVYKYIRANHYPTDDAERAAAAERLRGLLGRVWWGGRALYVLLMGAALFLAK